MKNLFYFNEEIKNMRKKPRVGLETKRTVPKKASRAERFLGNLARTARLERAGDVEGEDRKSEPGTESPTLAKWKVLQCEEPFFILTKKIRICARSRG